MTIKEQAAKVLPDAKNYLDILSTDDTTGDKKLLGILERGMNRINDSSGAEHDYTKEARPRELLFDYARYARANALEEWEDAFLSEILFLAHSVQIGAVSDD